MRSAVPINAEESGAYDDSGIVDSAENGSGRTGKIDGSEFPSRIQKAVVVEVAVEVLSYDLAGIIHPQGKSFDGFCPLGPWIVTKDEIPNPSNLAIR